MIWFGDDGEPVSFQLAYGKYRNERAIRWKTNEGFNHYNVDDGESGAVSRDAPILMAGGAFAASQILERFIELSEKVPREIVRFVAARLREHPGYRSKHFHMSGAAAIALVVAMIGVALLMTHPRRRDGDS